jgi:uncharacterized protein YprB with RNaseH-like and TPR domain
MLHDKLSRFQNQINASGSKSENETGFNRCQVAQRHLGGEICNLTSGSFLKIESNFDSAYRHGNLTVGGLNDFVPCKYIHFDRCGKDKSINPENLLFLDMETTGLGGSGTVPFLIGLGSVIEKSFQVRQYFLPDYPDEAAMLEAVRTEINKDTIIVSYNGKSFDIPILADRLIINRVERNLEFAEHIDLLHSARRMYRRRLKSCSLSNIESNILDFRRYGDIPGELVPAIYFNWLNEMGMELLGQVVEHNLNDVVSLYFLMYNIAQAQENPSGRLIDADDIYSVARIFEIRGEYDRVHRTLNEYQNIMPDSNKHELLYMLSLACKRTGRFDEAVKIWTEISGVATQKTYQALIELAKYNEHKRKDPKAALEVALRAQSICPARESERVDLNRRINRLNCKLTGYSL